MEHDIHWPSHIETTHHRQVTIYTRCAQQNTHNYNVLSAELDNIKEAAVQAGKLKKHIESLEIAKWLWSDGGRFLDLQGYAQLGEQLLTQALEAARSLSDKSQEEQVLGQLGRAWLAIGNSQTAGRYFQEALALAQEIGNQQGQASHLGCLGQIYLEQWKMQNAEEYFQQALTLAKKIPDRSLEGRVLGSLGLVMSLKGNQSEAIGLFERAVNIADEMGDWQGKASHLGGMGTAYKHLGIQNPPQQRSSFAGEFITEYLDTSERDKYYRNASSCFEKALNIVENMGDKKKVDEIKVNLAEMQALIANRPIKNEPVTDVHPNISMRNRPPSR